MPFARVRAQDCLTVLPLPQDTAGEKTWIATQCRILDMQKLQQLEFGINFLSRLQGALKALKWSKKIHTSSVCNVLAESLGQNFRNQTKTFTNFHQLELLL